MQRLRWNNPGTRHTSVFYRDRRLDVANQTRASGGGRKMFLTSPYIDQAITLKTYSCAKRTAAGSSSHRTPCPQLLGTQAPVAPMPRPLLDSRPGVTPHEVGG